MDTTVLIGKRVKHKHFGIGEITSFNGEKFRVTFKSGDTKLFFFPQAFTAYLDLEDESLMPAIIEEARKRKITEEARRKEESEKRELRAKQDAEKKHTNIFKENSSRNQRTYGATYRDVESPKMYGNGIIGPKTSFSTHADTLNTCFGYHYKAYQKAYKDLENGYAVWFPNIARKAGDHYLSSDEYWGWLNILSDSGDTIAQIDNPDHPSKRGLDKNRRIIFARFDNDNRYRFIGVYAYPKRIENGYTFSRIATMFDTKRMKIIDSEQK